MKRAVSVPMIIGAIVVLAAVLGFFAFKVAQPPEVTVPNSVEMKNRMMGSSGKLPAPSAGGQGMGSGNTQEQMMRTYGSGGREGGGRR